MSRRLKLGSLFDGSGGFPLAGCLCGVEPVWASEIEKYPIAVTTERFPGMKHLGDILQINGAEIEPVDIICFGSPCQDLSVAGKRSGLSGSRSSLFLEAIRIVAEMREATNNAYPKMLIWENVPGALSSKGGADFARVLWEFCSLTEGQEAADVPVPKDGWHYFGYIEGDGYSVGWRVLDAEHWGVPQRRRRVYAVCDLTGNRAREILSQREGLSGDFKPRYETWKSLASDSSGSTAGSHIPFVQCEGI